jgi:cyclic pyranopterin phosphate synthase
MQDKFGRTIEYMRISVTDRCNFRCIYCMPRGMLIPKVPMSEILTYEQILEVVRAAVSLGITKFKVTGGEPLVRRDCPSFIGMLKSVPGVSQVTLTTNGLLLADCLEELTTNGLDAVNISLDTLRPERFERIAGRGATGSSEQQIVGCVLRSIDAALEAGVPLKINTVLLHGINDDEWEDIARLAKDLPIAVRFIELMPMGGTPVLQGVSGQDILRRICQRYPGVEEDRRRLGNGPAQYYHIPGWKGDIGFISAVHGRFCGSCNRLRLTARGHLRPCLCYNDEVDLRDIFRQYPGDGDHIPALRQELLRKKIARAILDKPEANNFDVDFEAGLSAGTSSEGIISTGMPGETLSGKASDIFFRRRAGSSKKRDIMGEIGG